MRRDYRIPLRGTLTALVRSVTDRVQRWRGRPPEEAGVREPRRPRPTLPAAAVALEEPRLHTHRWIRLTGLTWRRETDH
jgi:hypothetical protein